MKKTIYIIALSILTSQGLISCSSDTNSEGNEPKANAEQVEDKGQEEIEQAEPAPAVEKSKLGNFESLVGEWTVDAATAGVKMNLIFGEDGSFKQLMGNVNGTGTWEVVDQEHVKIVTQNTKGQTWKITDITERSVNMCWNPDSPKPKTIPMQRVK